MIIDRSSESAGGDRVPFAGAHTIGETTLGSIMNRAVFLDRDGVLNEAPAGANGISRPPAGVADLLAVDAGGALPRLRSAGFLLLVVTNQPDVARGTLSMNAVEVVNDELAARLPIDAVYVCARTRPTLAIAASPSPG
jgi:D-glycero-D-manno-heptose 1,7-bisphosphate phosphatase